MNVLRKTVGGDESILFDFESDKEVKSKSATTRWRIAPDSASENRRADGENGGRCNFDRTDRIDRMEDGGGSGGGVVAGDVGIEVGGI